MRVCHRILNLLFFPNSLRCLLKNFPRAPNHGAQDIVEKRRQCLPRSDLVFRRHYSVLTTDASPHQMLAVDVVGLHERGHLDVLPRGMASLEVLREAPRITLSFGRDGDACVTTRRDKGRLDVCRKQS